MTTDANTLLAAYEQLKVRSRAATENVAHCRAGLAAAEAEASSLVQAKEALRVVLGIEEDADDHMQDLAMGPGLPLELGSTTSNGPVGSSDRGRVDAPVSGGPPEYVPTVARKHIRSGAMVLDAVRAGGGTPVHRDQIVQYFEDQGVTAGMKNVRNAVNTALYRAVQRGDLIQVTADTFIRPEDTQPNTDAADDESNELGGKHA